MRIVFETFHNYRGQSLYLTLFLLAFLYLFITEKDKNIRILFLYCSAGVAAVVIFPLTAYFVMNYLMDTEIYYRQLWLMPYAVTVCYALVRMMIKTRRRIGKAAVLAAGLFAMMLTGVNVFGSGNFTRAQNAYHIPPEVIEVCDAILDDDIEYIPTAAFPQRLVEYTRQYTAEITTVYGREAIIERWNMQNELLSLIEAPILEAEQLATIGRADGAECIVVDAAKVMNGRMEDYGFYLVGNTAGYDIYLEGWLASRHRGFRTFEE